MYSGNLIASLTVVRPTTPFKTVAELVEHPEYKYGTLGGTGVIDYLRVILIILDKDGRWLPYLPMYLLTIDYCIEIILT